MNSTLLTPTSAPTSAPLLIELFVEELPPKALNTLGEAFASTIQASLVAQGLCTPNATKTVFASPRRLGVLIDAVATKGVDKPFYKSSCQRPLA
jgi:glycyl-tRNA synthetase beta chain